MTSTELEVVIARTRHERFRRLTSDDNPDVAEREGFRRIVREMAAGVFPAQPPAAYPSVLTQFGNAAGALGRFVASGMAVLDDHAVEARRAVCRTCVQYDEPARRCRICGCYTEAKTRSAAERCPLGLWPGDAKKEG